MIDASDPDTWPGADVNTPPRCPRCGGVHADVYQVAWESDAEEDIPDSAYQDTQSLTHLVQGWTLESAPRTPRTP